jgi:pyruvate dehydrogenase E2 component (dihydrolipoamide acetyltransferase)
MPAKFTRVDRLSSWRRISLHLWNKPRDPTVYGNLEIDMTTAGRYLEAANRLSDGVPVTVTHLVTKAIANAVARYPEANGIIARRRIYARDSVDVFCQVATEGGADLSGIKIENADSKSPIDIASEMDARVRRVLDNTDAGAARTKSTVASVPHSLLGWVLGAVEFLTYDLRLDLGRFGVPYDQFGSAMVSNVGSFAVEHGLAPLVPASRVPIVLLVGEVKDRAIVKNGQVVAAPAMTIGCTFDHRMIDGFQAGQLATVVKDCLHDPFTAFGLPSRPASDPNRIEMASSGEPPANDEQEIRSPAGKPLQ